MVSVPEGISSGEDLDHIYDMVSKYLRFQSSGVIDIQGAIDRACRELDISLCGTVDATLSDDKGMTVDSRTVRIGGEESHQGVLRRHKYHSVISLDSGKHMEFTTMVDSYTIPSAHTPLKKLFYEGGRVEELYVENNCFEYIPSYEGEDTFTHVHCEPRYAVVDLVFDDAGSSVIVNDDQVQTYYVGTYGELYQIVRDLRVGYNYA